MGLPARGRYTASAATAQIERGPEVSARTLCSTSIPIRSCAAFRFARTSLFLFIGCLPACAQAAPPASSALVETTAGVKENQAILEVGAATSWNTSGGAAAFAPNIAVEIEPIENWLELELGVSAFYTHGAKEWDTDLLFKKPWTLSRKAEFMLGIGPQWAHINQGGRWTNSLAGEVAGDFMFWPTGKHRFGCRLADVLWGGEIGITAAEIDDVDALLAQHAHPF